LDFDLFLEERGGTEDISDIYAIGVVDIHRIWVIYTIEKVGRCEYKDDMCN